MRKSWAGALATSCFIHVALVGCGAWLLSRAFGSTTLPLELVVVEPDPTRGIELPRASSVVVNASSEGRRLGVAEQRPTLGGGPRDARPDLEHRGRGGRERAGTRALNLTDRAVPIALNRDQTTLASQSQIQRLQVGTARRSWDDRRATPNPMQLSFVVTGPGTLRERRPASLVDPATGKLTNANASRAGALHGNPTPHGGTLPQTDGGREGALPQEQAGARGRGKPMLSARVITARPPVQRSRAAVPASSRGRPTDNVNSSHEVDLAVRSLVHAGGLGGPQGAGVGGQRAPGAPGLDGLKGSGARSAPSGAGNGAGLTSSDNGFGRYTQRLLSQIHWRSAFPSWAIAEGRGGLTVVQLTLDRAGRVRVANIVRGSGVDEFDANLLKAIHRDGPYGPLPPALGSQLIVKIAFDATNPAVGREGGGPGGRHR